MYDINFIQRTADEFYNMFSDSIKKSFNQKFPDEIKQRFDLLTNVAHMKLDAASFTNFPQPPLSSILMDGIELKELKKKQQISVSGDYFQRLLKLLITIEKPEKVYHYTNMKALFEILKNKSLWFTSLAGLNDKSEFSSSELYYSKEIKKEFHHKRIESANQKFIFSLSKLGDNLNQWRLYGDNGAGACLEFDFNKTYNFLDHIEINGIKESQIIHGNVLYNDIFFKELRRIHKFYSDKKNIDILYHGLPDWKHFIKIPDFFNEEEYRLIVLAKAQKIERCWYLNSYGIFNTYINVKIKNLPLKLKKIIIGPKCPEKDLNVGQLKLFLRDNNFDEKEKIHVIPSKITRFR